MTDPLRITGVEVVIEPGLGGRIYERTPEGEEHDWGQVTGWDPPSRISYLWHLRQRRPRSSPTRT